MLESEQDSATGGKAPSVDPSSSGEASSPPSSAPIHEESIVEELGALIDDARLYAEAEIAFQKTRASLVGKSVGVALGAVVLAIILLHIALIALAVGLVLALEPFVTIWGAIAIVVGVMLLGVAGLGWIALSRGRLVSAMFAAGPDAASQSPATDGDPE